MKGVVEARARGQLEAVGDVVDDGGDAVRSEELRLELPFRRDLEGCWGAMAGTEPHPIAHRIANIAMVLFVVVPIDGLRLLRAVADVGKELISVGHALGHLLHARLVWFIRADGGRVVAVDDPK
jgi:hypothetical protein